MCMYIIYRTAYGMTMTTYTIISVFISIRIEPGIDSISILS